MKIGAYLLKFIDTAMLVLMHILFEKAPEVTLKREILFFSGKQSNYRRRGNFRRVHTTGKSDY
jgi:hypothetical protein